MTPTDNDQDDQPLDYERPLTDAQIDHIVERTVEKVFERIYAEVGKSVVKKLMWAVGFAVTALAIWLVGTGAQK